MSNCEHDKVEKIQNTAPMPHRNTFIHAYTIYLRENMQKL